MKKYLSFFRIRFLSGLQYRLVMFSAMTTQILWAILEILAFYALWQNSSASFPMEFDATVTYVWLKEAFLALFNTWAADDDTANIFIDGGIAYEMCRPISMYGMWFSRSLAGRLSEAALRCIPVLLAAVLLPAPFKISAPAGPAAFILFILTTILGLFVTLSFCIMVYILCFFTISPKGWRMVLTGAVDLLSGMLLPLPFFPEPVRKVVELLPFASMGNVPFRIYSGDLAGAPMLRAIVLQLTWLGIMVICGNLICRRAQHRVVVQGG